MYKKKASKTINISKFNNDVCLDKKFLKLFLDNFKIKNYKLQKSEINLPHRNEIIRNYKNFIFINDSKSTNSASLKYSLSKYDNIILICGGLIKKGDNWQLGKLKKKIKITYIIGKEPAKIIYSLKKQKIKYFVSEKLSKTIDIIKEKYLNHEKKNKIKVNILFSPGTSSYDQYKNFEMRGNHFKKLINAF